MAELLCKAKAHWMDGFKQEDIDKMDPVKKQEYEARSQIGDIIVVKPDGWAWGRCECPPDFVVVKLPGVKAKDVKHYEDSLMSNDIILKRRKHAIPTTMVNTCKVELGGAKEISKATFDTNLITKVE